MSGAWWAPAPSVARCGLLFANLRDWVKKKNTANAAAAANTNTTVHNPGQADEPVDDPQHAPATAAVHAVPAVQAVPAAPPALSRIERQIDAANNVTENLVGRGARLSQRARYCCRTQSASKRS